GAGAEPGALALYGSDAQNIRDLERAEPALAQTLDPQLPCTGAQVIWAARREYARTVEDVLARRCRALFLNAAAAMRMAPAVASLLAREFGRDAAWERDEIRRFEAIASGYLLTPRA